MKSTGKCIITLKPTKIPYSHCDFSNSLWCFRLIYNKGNADKRIHLFIIGFSHRNILDSNGFFNSMMPQQRWSGDIFIHRDMDMSTSLWFKLHLGHFSSKFSFGNTATSSSATWRRMRRWPHLFPRLGGMSVWRVALEGVPGGGLGG